jgi:UDP-N-acetylenolpyruvoylglucosamine reductase
LYPNASPPSPYTFPYGAAMPCVTLGRGSNTLFDDRGFDGVVAVNCIATLERTQTPAEQRKHKHKRTAESKVEEEAAEVAEAGDVAAVVSDVTMADTSTCSAGDDMDQSGTALEEEEVEGEFASFRVGAGYPFNQLGASLSRDGWSGLEFAIGIPGTVGRVWRFLQRYFAVAPIQFMTATVVQTYCTRHDPQLCGKRQAQHLACYTPLPYCIALIDASGIMTASHLCPMYSI